MVPIPQVLAKCHDVIMTFWKSHISPKLCKLSGHSQMHYSWKSMNIKFCTKVKLHSSL